MIEKFIQFKHVRIYVNLEEEKREEGWNERGEIGRRREREKERNGERKNGNETIKIEVRL